VAITFSLEEIEDSMADDGGFCLACGEPASGVEPDARCYKCESCGEREVYGAEEIVMMGLVTDGESDDDAGYLEGGNYGA
jgi:hypothetical protein